MAKVYGRPFVSVLLDRLSTVGFRRVVLCTGYMAEVIEGALGHTYGGMELVYSREANPLGTAGALRLALPAVASNEVLVLNGDSLCLADLPALVSWHQDRQAVATMLVTRVDNAARYGRVDLDVEGCVTHFNEKDGESRPGQINAGTDVLTRAFLEAIPAGENLSLEQDVFPAWIGRGLHGYSVVAPFLDIGTPESLALAEGFVASGVCR
jgi:NDP-sugar pyrophosphorylase family protein